MIGQLHCSQKLNVRFCRGGRLIKTESNPQRNAPNSMEEVSVRVKVFHSMRAFHKKPYF